MNPFKHLLCFEFSKYSSCFEAMNRIAENSGISVFEVSPTPGGGILVLTSSDLPPLEAIFSSEKKIMQASLLKSCLIERINDTILEAYLSQNRSPEIGDLSFFETNSLCQGFEQAQRIAQHGGRIIDFRVIRSVFNRAILIYTHGESSEDAITIAKPTKLVQEYFQILK